MIKIKKSPSADSRTATGKVSKQELYESSAQHICDVRQGLEFFTRKLASAGIRHDYTKVDPDGIRDFYDSFSKGLKDDEFKATKWYQRHIHDERHHLKDYCPDDVNLIYVLERIADIVMAGMGRSGFVYADMLPPEILQKAYANTIEMLKKEVEIQS